MSNQPGFDYDQMFNRLHLGVRGLQHWRDNRRARFVDGGAPASAPTVVAAASGTAAPQPAEMGPTAGPPTPRGYVSVGGELFPVYSDTQFRSRPDAPASPATEPVPPEPAPPTATAAPPSPPSAPPAPTADRLTRLSSVAPLKIPLPTPPPCLGRAGTPDPIDDEPASASEPATTAQPANTAAAMDPELLEAVLQHHRDAEAARLEQVHAEHRALVAGMLEVHRTQIADQAEDQRQLIRDLLTGHRAELDARAEAMRLLLTQHREDVKQLAGATDQVSETRAQSTADMHDWLTQQVKHQAQAQAQAEQHLADLADMLGGLGQTVGHLAAATFERKPTFVPPPLAAIPWPPPSPATTQSFEITSSPATTPSSATMPSIVTPPSLKLSTPEPSADLAPQPDRPPAPVPACAGTSSTHKASPPSPRSPQQQRHEASLAQARVHEVVEAFDDDDLQDIVDPEEPPPRTQLPPFTPPDHLDGSDLAHV